MEKEGNRRNRRFGGRMREKSWCDTGAAADTECPRENKGREEHEDEMEQWAIVRREYDISVA